MLNAHPFPLLFRPFELAGRRLRNRIVFPATLANYASGNAVTGRLIDYYAERARGGAGMIVTEGLSVHASSVPQPSVVTLFEPGNADGLQRLAAAVEREDCRLIGQLWHVGRQQLWNPVLSPVGVSPEPDAYSWTVPHVLDVDEIRALVEAFVSSARCLARAGFSGVELHGAHGYLITQFLSPWSNTRDDAYGGDRVRRLRFVREIIAGIRAECGNGFILGLKMPGNEGVAGGIDPVEAAGVVRLLAEAGGPDYLAFSQGNFSLSLEDHVPDLTFRPGPFLDIHKALKAHAGAIAVMALGRVLGPHEAEACLRDSGVDLVATGRALVSDAAWPDKAQRGRADEIRPCIFCNVCWGEIHAGKPMACIHNPHLAMSGEVAWAPAAAAQGKTVVVVGAGVAGLEAAWVAAARGHRVLLFGHSPEPGGKARLEAALPGRAEVAKVYDYQRGRAERHGVAFRLGQWATVEAIAAERPDAVILATGAAMRRPAGFAAESGGIDLRSYLSAPQIEEPTEGTAVLFDQDHAAATYAAADLLARRFARLVLITPRTQLARNVAYVSAIGVYRRLYGAGAEIVLASTLRWFEHGTLAYANAFTGRETRIDGVALLVWSTPRLAADGLAPALRRAGLAVTSVGDCRAPRTMLAAIHEGHAAGNAL